MSDNDLAATLAAIRARREALPAHKIYEGQGFVALDPLVDPVGDSIVLARFCRTAPRDIDTLLSLVERLQAAVVRREPLHRRIADLAALADELISELADAAPRADLSEYRARLQAPATQPPPTPPADPIADARARCVIALRAARVAIDDAAAGYLAAMDAAGMDERAQVAALRETMVRAGGLTEEEL